MKGHYEKNAKGDLVDVPPCRTCKHKGRMTVQYPCYNCIEIMDLALHKPNAETEFAYYEPEATP